MFIFSAEYFCVVRFDDSAFISKRTNPLDYFYITFETSKEPTIIYIQGLGPNFPKKVEFIPNGNKQPIIGVCKYVFAIICLILP